jgi:hypothetical protein
MEKFSIESNVPKRRYDLNDPFIDIDAIRETEDNREVTSIAKDIVRIIHPDSRRSVQSAKVQNRIVKHLLHESLRVGVPMHEIYIKLKRSVISQLSDLAKAEHRAQPHLYKNHEDVTAKLQTVVNEVFSEARERGALAEVKATIGLAVEFSIFSERPTNERGEILYHRIAMNELLDAYHSIDMMVYGYTKNEQAGELRELTVELVQVKNSLIPDEELQEIHDKHQAFVSTDMRQYPIEMFNQEASVDLALENNDEFGQQYFDLYEMIEDLEEDVDLEELLGCLSTYCPEEDPDGRLHFLTELEMVLDRLASADTSVSSERQTHKMKNLQCLQTYIRNGRTQLTGDSPKKDQKKVTIPIRVSNIISRVIHGNQSDRKQLLLADGQSENTVQAFMYHEQKTPTT